jgi:hypothetical protein
MSTESLAAMTLPELRRERQLAKNNAVAIQFSMAGTRGADRIELEEAVKENRDYIETINARIARLERKERN